MSDLTLKLTVSGKLGEFTLENSEYTYSLTDQTAVNGPKSFVVPANTLAGGLSRCLDPIGTQNALLVLVGSTGAAALVRINGGPLDFEVQPGGFLVIPGGPVATELEFGNTNTTKDADVTVIQVGLAGTPSTAVGGSYQFENLGPAVLAQTEFPLAQTPADPDKLMFFLDRVPYNAGADAEVTVVVAGAGAPKVVWSGAALAGGEIVHVIY